MNVRGKLYFSLATTSGRIVNQKRFIIKPFTFSFLKCKAVSFLDRNFYPFIMHQSMQDVRNKAVFLHVCMPGQDDNEPNLAEK